MGHFQVQSAESYVARSDTVAPTPPPDLARSSLTLINEPVVQSWEMLHPNGASEHRQHPPAAVLKDTPGTAVFSAGLQEGSG